MPDRARTVFATLVAALAAATLGGTAGGAAAMDEPTICPISAPTASGARRGLLLPPGVGLREPVERDGRRVLDDQLVGQRRSAGRPVPQVRRLGRELRSRRGWERRRGRERRPAEHGQALRVHDPLSGDALWRDGHGVRGRCGESAAVTASASSTSAAATSAASGMLGRDRQRRGREDRLPGRLRLHESERYGRDERSMRRRRLLPPPPPGLRRLRRSAGGDRDARRPEESC